MIDRFGLADKVAIVTGSTRGIGRAIATMFRDAGASVVVSSEDHAETASAAGELGATGIACDVANEEALNRLVEQTIARLGAIDILVCNAGIAGTEGDVSGTEFDKVIGVNLRSQFVLTSLAMPHLARRVGAAAVLMSSLSGMRGNRAIHSYAVAKAGVAQLARNLAVQWGPKGVRVNAISPGLVETGFSAPLMADKQFLERRLQMTPLRRVGTAEEVAAAVLFLASPAAAFITGHNLVVDGGTLVTDGG